MAPPVIFHSGGDVVMSGFGRLDTGAQEHLAAVYGDEVLSAIIAGDHDAMTAAQARGHALLTARNEARRWAKASAVSQ